MFFFFLLTSLCLGNCIFRSTGNVEYNFQRLEGKLLFFADPNGGNPVRTINLRQETGFPQRMGQGSAGREIVVELMSPREVGYGFDRMVCVRAVYERVDGVQSGNYNGSEKYIENFSGERDGCLWSRTQNYPECSTLSRIQNGGNNWWNRW